MKRAFSLVEILIVLVLIAVIMSFGLYWLSNYLYARKVEETTYQLYSTLKEYQLKAKTR
ncbi:MAG: type II secretion system protein, partial [Aquificae bacterium]|nr:type II secretion system protein [Aquificota bacterium]